MKNYTKTKLPMVFDRYSVQETDQVGLLNYSEEQFFIVFDLC